MSSKKASFWNVGDCVFIRTVTLYYVGRVVGFSDTEILLEEASWIADTGRFMQALATGSLSEVEPYPEGIVCVNRTAIIDASKWLHALPRTQK